MFTPRELEFKKQRNVRDLGGYKTKDGRSVKYNLLYRGVNLAKFNNEKDILLFLSLNIKTNIDFRSRKEINEAPDSKIPGMDYYHLPAMVYEDGSDIDFSPEGMAELFSKGEILREKIGHDPTEQEIFDYYYGRMLGNTEPYGKMFKLLLEDRVPMYFHCTAGKDRTGVAAILILLALGVSKEDVLDDYLYTNVCYRQRLEKMLEINAEKIKLKPELEAQIIGMYGVEVGGIAKQLDEIEELYGDFDSFFKEHYKLSDDDLKRLRDLYTE